MVTEHKYIELNSPISKLIIDFLKVLKLDQHALV